MAGQLGLEKTPEEYIERMVGVFRHVWRVLRDDGTCWLNMGDSYAQGGKQATKTELAEDKQRAKDKNYSTEAYAGYDGWNRAANTAVSGLKPKDLCMMPARLAIALQADGWYLRSDIIWAKPNPMPESVTDRPTKSHEHIFLLTKRSKYFYDADAVREPHARLWDESNKGNLAHPTGKALEQGSGFCHHGDYPLPNPAGRNKRDVWTIPTQSFPEAHFATFPEKLVQPCIKAGTSEKGCCPECGSPWVRVVEKDRQPTRAGLSQKTEDYNYDTQRHCTTSTTIGWKPTCECNPVSVSTPIPCTVYDPFAGAATTCLVAYKLNRHYVGTELNAEYIEMAEKRLAAEKDKYALIE